MTENTLRLLTELRQRLLNCFLFFAFIFLILLYFSNDLYTQLARPILKFLPQGHELIATNITAPFFVPFDLTIFAAVILAVPFFLYQLWSFVAPALYLHEKKILWPMLFIATILFYAGMMFAYFVVFPLLFNFLTHAAPKGVSVYPDMSLYLDLTLKLFFIFGAIFEIPVIIIFLVKTKIVSREKMIRVRPYAVISAFILGMLLAPPDIVSQTCVAVPMWLLYELGLVICNYTRDF